MGIASVCVSGAFLTRGELISKGDLDSSEFAEHSFRIDAATTAASANFPPWALFSLVL